MLLNAKNKALAETLQCYSSRQLQFAIRLRVLPTPDKLNSILSSKSSSENEIKLLVKNLEMMKA
ncbi:MAG: hypothetical protein Q8M99_04960 [Methylotenera sp.]|nr:hypothetical protein [Methylotenera sp.]